MLSGAVQDVLAKLHEPASMERRIMHLTPHVFDAVLAWAAVHEGNTFEPGTCHAMVKGRQIATRRA